MIYPGSYEDFASYMWYAITGEDDTQLDDED